LLHRLTVDAFTLTPETSESAIGLKNLPTFSRANIHHRPGGLAVAVTHYMNNSSSDIIIVEDDGNAEQLASRLESLSHVVEPGRKLIVVGSVNDIGIYRRMISMGVAEYLVSPSSIEELVSAIEHVTHDPQGPARGKVLAFFGARGGVGTSTIAHNVAWCLSHEFQQRAIVVDLDLSFGTAALAFNEDPRQPLAEALVDPDRLDQLLLQRFMVGDDERLKVLSTNGLLRPTMPTSVVAIEKLIELSRQLADFVVLDLPHVWVNWIEDLLTTADEATLAITLDLANLRESKSLMEYMRGHRGSERAPHYIINKSDWARRARLNAQDIQRALATKPLASIPFDPLHFVEAVNDGKVISAKMRKHKASVAFRAIAQQLGKISQKPQGAGMFKSFLSSSAGKKVRK